jgi:hypothetical protein
MDKPTTAVLLGAGASRDAGIPTTEEMTQKVINQMTDPLHVRLLQFIHHMLAADMATKTPQGTPSGRVVSPTDVSDPRASVDVERLFAAVELLIDRHDQPWSPFVSSWSSGLDSFSSGPVVRSQDLSYSLHGFQTEFEREINKALSALVPTSGVRGFPSSRAPKIDGRSIRERLAKAIAEGVQRGRPTELSMLLRRVRAEMLRSLFALLRVDEETNVDYLRPLGNLARRQGGLTIGTLNYDRTVEEVCRRQRVGCQTGIETWLKGGDLVLTSTGVRLLKLHGSITWVPVTQSADGLPYQWIEMLDPGLPEDRSIEPAVIFGESGKLRAGGPFLELLLRFASEIRKADTLLIVGYSFRDQHINEVVARWFGDVPERRIVVVTKSDLRSRPQGSFAWKLASPAAGAAGSDGRVLQVNGNTADVLAAAIKAAASRKPFPQPAPS